MNHSKRSLKAQATSRSAFFATVFVVLNAAATCASLGQNLLRVHTQPANMIRVTSAMLNGMILPGSNPATVWFEWGTSRNYGNFAGLTNLASGNRVIALLHILNDLGPNYVYHCRLVASNAAGLVYGADQQFTLGASVFVWGNPAFGHTIVPEDLTNAVAISAGGDHCLALRNDGSVKAWGGNAHGQRDVPTDLGDVHSISAGQYHNLALQSDGTVRAWGAGTTFSPNPTTGEGGQSIVPAGLSNVVQIAAGTTHSLALKSDGTVAAWGSAWLLPGSWNALGQAQVPAGLSNVVAISGGDFHNLALKADGTVVTWGYNTHGQAVTPAGLSNVVAIAAGWYHNLALKDDHTVAPWGYDGFGAVSGLPPGLTNVAGVAGGGFYSMAFLGDGTATGWGADGYGQASGAAILANVVALAGGYDFALALLPGAPLEVALSIQPLGNQLQLIWIGGVLQSAGEVDGQYTDMTGVTSPHVFTPSEEQQFYRVKVQQ